MDTPQQTAIPTGLMFKLPKLNYTFQSRGDGRDSHQLQFDMQTISICGILSVAWAGLVIAYGIGLINSIGIVGSVPSFIYACLAMNIIFPIVLIWACFFVYHFAEHSYKASNEILEAARILGSPALVAAEDVKTLSSAVGHELNLLRSSMRDVEDNMNGVSKRIDSEINTLNESGDKLRQTLFNISGTIRAERDAIIDLMKIIKKENENARHYLADQDKTLIQVSDIPNQNSMKIPEKPTEIGELIGGEITYVDDLRPQNQIQTIITDSSEHLNTIESLEHNHVARKPVQFPTNSEHVKSENISYNLKPEAVILRRERQLYEGVCALTVDLNRELGITLPQDLWSRYMRGERHVFADHLFSKLDSSFQSYIEVLDTEPVRKLCNQFVARFETLRERLFDEPNVAVSEYLETSGVGKIYNILSAEYV